MAMEIEMVEHISEAELQKRFRVFLRDTRICLRFVVILVRKLDIFAARHGVFFAWWVHV